jgi:transposase
MRINYPKAIGESEEDLLSLEQRLRGQKTADRVRMLRLLKGATVKSMKDCAPLVGYSLVQLTRWWECYRTQGLAELVKQQKPIGQPCKVTAEAWEGLLAAMRKGDITTMEDARDYLEREWGIRYKNGKSLWWLFKKHRVKWKTGRRRHKKVNAEHQAVLKKTSEA